MARSERSDASAAHEGVAGWRRWAAPYVRRMLPALLIAYWGALFVATHVPLPQSGAGGVNDKLLHFGAYSVLALLLAWVLAAKHGPLATWAITVLACSTYGLVDEWLQRSIPRRTADFWDFVADVCGAIAGAAVLIGLQFIWRRYKNNRPAHEEPI